MMTIEQRLSALKDDGPILAKTVGPGWWAFLQCCENGLGFWVSYETSIGGATVHFRSEASASTAYAQTVAQLEAGNKCPWVTDKALPPRCLRRTETRSKGVSA